MFWCFRATGSLAGRFQSPRSPAPVRYTCVQDLSMVRPMQIPSIPPCKLAKSSSTGNSYRRGRSGLAWYGGNNDALKLLMSSV